MARSSIPPADPTCAHRGCSITRPLTEWSRWAWCPTHLDAVIEGAARMARARRECGQPVTDEDAQALDAFPDVAYLAG